MNDYKILLVDDDEDDQFIFINALKEITAEHKCVIANNGMEALSHLKAGPSLPDLIFLDLNMPVMNGIELILILKADYRFADIPAVIYTTSDNPDEKKQMKELGVSAFLTKTANFKKLKTELARILEEGKNISFSLRGKRVSS
jgi:CheY-like chemotaxis protein